MQGLILLDKPGGITSFGAVARLKRIYSTKRAGHTGTLDPMATGVLPVLIGRATRLCELMLESDKRYEAEILFGQSTDTMDITGTVISSCDMTVLKADLLCALKNFTGEIRQTPPMYSAIKKDGVRLYELARNGVEVERESRTVTVKEINLLRQSGPNRFTVDVLCSKGTYIRSLADDIGRFLGCGAVLTALRRTYTAGIDISQCASLEEIEHSGGVGFVLPADKAVEYLPQATITEAQQCRFMNGGELSLGRVKFGDAVRDGQLVRVYGSEFVGLGRIDLSAELLRVKCIIAGGD